MSSDYTKLSKKLEYKWEKGDKFVMTKIKNFCFCLFFLVTDNRSIRCLRFSTGSHYPYELTLVTS